MMDSNDRQYGLLLMDSNERQQYLGVVRDPPPHLNHNPSILLHSQSQPFISSTSSSLPFQLSVSGGGESTTMSMPTGIHHPYGLHYHHQNQNPVGVGYDNPDENKIINTLFISGLPDDVKPREIHNLFSRRHGFESCQLKYTGRRNQVVAFATFSNHTLAMAALDALNGVTFDPQTGATLHVELARSNSRHKRSRGHGGSDEPSSTDKPNSSNKGALTAAQSAKTMGDLDNAQATPHEQLEKPVGAEIPPCSTLFIANLGPSCTEEELKQVLSQYTGFHMLKMQARGGMPVAFADFQEIEQATEAMESLQGSLLASSDRGGLHLEYARSKMRKSHAKE
ncbi:RNA-binding (RRM/RBD/RNP motifs) family protein isoform X2 [Tasmannia lanceolata]|uniref:RNA-binding (RRM/RBD/RNP motifs) family protein isoform X2 n=1 Tax=Tasmannia lanceolata TaxID=3420 RepID=UPI004064AED9